MKQHAGEQPMLSFEWRSDENDSSAYLLQNRYLAAKGYTQPVPVLNWFRLRQKQELREAEFAELRARHVRWRH